MRTTQIASYPHPKTGHETLICILEYQKNGTWTYATGKPIRGKSGTFLPLLSTSDPKQAFGVKYCTFTGSKTLLEAWKTRVRKIHATLGRPISIVVRPLKNSLSTFTIKIVQPQLPGETYTNWLLTQPGLSAADITREFCAILTSVVAFHSDQVVHRNLKLDKMLRMASEQKVSCHIFGFEHAVRDNNQDYQTAESVGTVPYVAPEMRNTTAPIPIYESADIYSLGVVLLNLLDHLEITPNLSDTAAKLNHLVNAMLDLNPANRPSAHTCLAFLTHEKHATLETYLNAYEADYHGTPTEKIPSIDRDIGQLAGYLVSQIGRLNRQRTPGLFNPQDRAVMEKIKGFQTVQYYLAQYHDARAHATPTPHLRLLADQIPRVLFRMTETIARIQTNPWLETQETNATVALNALSPLLSCSANQADIMPRPECSTDITHYVQRIDRILAQVLPLSDHSTTQRNTPCAKTQG